MNESEREGEAEVGAGRQLDLDPARLGTTLARLSAPAVFENLLITLLLVSDGLIVGWLRHPQYLAAVAFTNVVTQLLQAPFQALGVAATARIAQLWGRRDFRGGRRAAGQSLLVAFGLAALLVALGWALVPAVFRWFGASADVTDAGIPFLRVILASNLAGFPMLVANGALRATGDTRTPMRNMLVVVVANVCVSLTLAFGPGPLPAFGFMGVCWGTFTARTVGCLLALAAVFSRRRSLAARGSDLLAWDPEQLGPLARLALPTAAERWVNAVAHTAFISVVSRLGTETLAAHMIAVNIEALCFMPAVGLGAAVTAMVGQAVGAGQAGLGRRATARAIRWSLAGSLALGAVYLLLAPWIVRLYGSSPEVLRQAAIAVRIAALEMPCLAAAIVLASACRGAGDAASPLWVTLAALAIFRFGVVYLLAVSLGWGIAGVWLSTAADWATRAAALTWFFRRRMAKLAAPAGGEGR